MSSALDSSATHAVFLPFLFVTLIQHKEVTGSIQPIHHASKHPPFFYVSLHYQSLLIRVEEEEVVAEGEGEKSGKNNAQSFSIHWVHHFAPTKLCRSIMPLLPDAVHMM